jgi:hypothetical protein
MNLTSPILKGAAHAAELPGDSVSSFVRMVADNTGLFADDSPDGALGMVMSGLSGVAAALAVAITLTLYFRTGYSNAREIVRHGLAATVVLGLVAFVAYDMRHSLISALTRQNPRSSLKSACQTGRCPTSPTPRSNCTPTETRGSPKCKARCRPMTMAAACSGVQCRWIIGPQTASWSSICRARRHAGSSCGSRRTPAIPISSDRGIWPIAWHLRAN